jgi:hypothetical protein
MVCGPLEWPIYNLYVTEKEYGVWSVRMAYL